MQRFYGFSFWPLLQPPLVYLQRSPPEQALQAELFPGALAIHGAEDFAGAVAFGRGNNFVTALVNPDYVYGIPIPGPQRLSLVLQPEAVKGCDGSLPLANLLVRYLAGDDTEDVTDWLREIRDAARGVSSTESHPRPELAQLLRQSDDGRRLADPAQEQERIQNIVLRCYAEGNFYHGARWVLDRANPGATAALHDELMGLCEPLSET